MSNTNSNIFGSYSSTPFSFNAAGKASGRLRVMTDSFEVTGDNFDGANDTIKLCRLPSRARIHSLMTWNDDFDSGTQSEVDIGLYNTDGTEADLDCYVDGGTVLQAADTSGTEHRFDALDIDTMGDPIWENAGASAETAQEYDVYLTQKAAVSSHEATFTLSFRIYYTLD